tara:strand:- start:17 stop:274 length:258 start_codon:yes stop_codon:yes gene_type:complete
MHPQSTLLEYGIPCERVWYHSLIQRSFSINNLGDPFETSNYGVHSRAFEIAVLDYFADLWKLPKDEYWGYVTWLAFLLNLKLSPG